ncbi:MAG: xanthine dehydrogenase small subunit [Vicinamibacterales bacterium]
MFTFTLNGTLITLDEVDPDLTLLDFIRQSGLTGAKEGCAEGECGACAVALVRPHGDASTYRVVNSCLMPLPMAAGHEVITIEGIAASGQDEALRALAAAGGSQCGYCTPGFAVSLTMEQCRPGRIGACSTEALAGNLCRCTGYRPIADAAASLTGPAAGPLSDRLQHPAPAIIPTRSRGFARPESVDACVALLAAHPAAVLVSGGTDVGVEFNLRGRRPELLVSLEAIDELRRFSREGSRVRIGAALPLTEIVEQWTDAPEVWRAWTALFASPLIRNRATLGGNLATASPIGDAAPLLMALDAVVHVAGPSGSRAVPVAELFSGYRKTVLAHHELIVEVEIPLPLPERVGFYKVAKRRVNDISTVTAALAVTCDAGGRVSAARCCFGGVGPTPVRVVAAEQAAAGVPWGPDVVARVQAVLASALAPISDHRGSRDYRLGVAQSLVAKFAWEHAR